MSHQDLVVTEVARGVESEELVDQEISFRAKLVAIFVRKRHGNFAVEDEVELGEVLKSFDDCLVGNEDPAVQS